MSNLMSRSTESCRWTYAERQSHRLARTLAAVGVAALAGGRARRNRASARTRVAVDDQRRRCRRRPGAHAGAIEAYQQKNPKLVAKVNFTKAPAPELPAKLKAMQAAGRSDIDLVLTGVVALSAGIDQGLWVKVLPDHAAKFPSVLDNYLPAARKMQDLAQGEALVVTFMPAGPAARIQPRQGQAAADDAAGAARVVQGESEPVRLRAACQFGSGLHVPDGAAVRARRQEPARSGQRLGQDVGVPEGARHVHRVLPVRHRRDDEGARRRVARHDGDDDRLGPEPAHPRHRAEAYKVDAVQEHDVGERRALHGGAQGHSAGEARRRARPDGVPAEARGAGAHVRQGLLLSGPFGQERAAVDGAQGEPGRDQASSAVRSTTMAEASSRTCRHSRPKRWSRRSAAGTATSARARRS